MRKPVMAGNWKMHKTQAEARAFIEALKPMVAASTHCEIILAPPFTALATAAKAALGSQIGIAAQDCHAEPCGAFTGEVSVPMLLEAGCSGVIIGHSERRQFFGETDEGVASKVKAALIGGLRPIVCMGETLAERESGLMEAVLKVQFEGGLGALTPGEFSHILVAYEPVWAIGTGRSATPELADAAHRFLRQLAAKRFSEESASSVRILYGGSVKPDNVKGLMAKHEIDGALVGGASLDPSSFAALVNYQSQ